MLFKNIITKQGSQISKENLKIKVQTTAEQTTSSPNRSTKI